MPGYSTLNKTKRPTKGSLLGADENGSPIRFSSEMLPYVYNIKDYGAVVDGVTDDTVAVQATINAAITGGGGTVFFPTGITIINGVLQHNVDTGKDYNSQLWFPQLAANSNNWAFRPSITLIGEVSAPTWVSAGISYSVPNNLTGSVIKSTLSHTGVGGDWPAIFGGGGTGIVDDFSFIKLRFENLTIVSPHDNDYGTFLTAINAKNISCCQVVNCNITNDRSMFGSTIPSECAGIILAKDRCDHHNFIENTAIASYKYGIIGSEHLYVNNIAFICCTNAFGLTSAFYTLTGGLVLIHWCNCLFKSMEAYHPGLALSHVFLKIQMIEIEDADFVGQRYDGPMQYWIDDPNSRIWGKVEYIYRRPSSYGTTVLKNGGLHLEWTELTNEQMVPTW